MPKKYPTYRLFCEMASFLKFDKGVTILLLDPVQHTITENSWFQDNIKQQINS